LLQALKHIGECGHCSAIYADSFDADALAEVPDGFAEEVVSKATAAKENKRQYILYSIRVAVAACASLAIVFSGVLNSISNADYTANIRPPNLAIVNSINADLQDVSQKILNMEAYVNEKERK
jgi:hypothetical protein